MNTRYVGADELHRLMTLRDLTDLAQGPHGMQLLLEHLVGALTGVGGCTATTVRTPPLVSVRDNYDRLGFAPADATRDARYTRYVSPTVMLRSHTSADVPHALERYAREGSGRRAARPPGARVPP